MNNNCEFANQGGCMCDACQSMRETIKELKDLECEDIMKKEEAKKIFEEMKKELTN